MNDKEVREMLENEKVPEELEPERIKEMLDEKAPAVKRKRITAVSRFAALAAACAVVSGTAVYVAGHGNKMNKKETVSDTKVSSVSTGTAPASTGTAPAEATTSAEVTTTAEPVEVTPPAPEVKAAYMTGAEDYSQIYELLRNAAEKQQKNSSRNLYGKVIFETNGIPEKTDEEVDMAEENDAKSAEAPRTSGGDDSEGGQAHSDTFNQEEGVLESDIVKTDGKYIYKLNQGGTYYYDITDEVDETTMLKGNKRIMPSVSIVEVNDGKFGAVSEIDLTEAVDKIMTEFTDDAQRADISARQMYLYNDMVIVIGTAAKWDKDYYYYDRKTFAAAYSADGDHKLIGTYLQDGNFNDVRIAPDGYLYLISEYYTQNYSRINGAENIRFYIPEAGMAEAYDFLAPADILMPGGELQPETETTYSVISSLDLNTSGSMTTVSTKALAGYSGQIYCSAENLYTAVYNYNDDLPENVEYGYKIRKTSESTITRIAVSGGQITPEASGNIAGMVNDQFSMSEYNGYFRVATTCNEYEMTYKKGYTKRYYEEDDCVGDVFVEKFGTDDEDEYGYYDYRELKQDNRLYVLDMDLKTIGSIGDFGIDESVKSVNFSGDMAYVVTYEQTDPLFAIDLSTPSEPKILDEYKMLGYSSYMQRWSDDLLLGFGPDADERGRVIGIKMVMFDNSDPNELKEVGKVALNSSDMSSVWSQATNDRKALLIAPEKNIIAFPTLEYMMLEDYDGESSRSSYRFYSYEDGKFVSKGSISFTNREYGYVGFIRALYIGDYVYAVAEDNTIYSADIDTITVKDNCKF